MMQRFLATYFDGQSTKAHAVSLRFLPGKVHILGREIERTSALDTVTIGAALGNAPRRIDFPDGTHCEIQNHAALAQALRRAGYRESWWAQRQQQWHWVLGVLLLSVALMFSGYRWGLPTVSEWLAYRLPVTTLNTLGEQSLTVLDKSFFASSQLDVARQQSLIAAFSRLEKPQAHALPLTIVFRKGLRVGANAFALPNGTVVVTDQLVQLADNDQEILAVLAHELGHLERRHSLRKVIQGSIVGAAAAWLLGDISSIVAGIPAMLLEMQYSREFELEADQYAADLLKRNGIPPIHLTDFLAKLSGTKGKKTGGKDADWRRYFSSHPSTSERIKRIQESQ